MANAKCPVCGAPVPETSAAFPFCNARCRLLDLGNWLDERYTIPTRPDDDDGTTPEDPDSSDPKSSLI